MDSGYRESGFESNSSMPNHDDKRPLQTIDKNSPKNEDVVMKSVEESLNERELKVTLEKLDSREDHESKRELSNGEEEMDFSITRQTFSESRSSLFKFGSPEKKIRRSDSTPSQRSSSSVTIFFFFFFCM